MKVNLELDLSNEKDLRALTALVNELNNENTTVRMDFAGNTKDVTVVERFELTDEMAEQIVAKATADLEKEIAEDTVAKAVKTRTKKPKAEEMTPEQSEVETSEAETPETTEEPVKEETKKPEVSLVTIRTRMSNLVKVPEKKEKLQKKMREFGAEKISEMSEQHYGAFFKYIQELENEQ